MTTIEVIGFGSVTVMLVRCVAVNNGTGIRASGGDVTLRSVQSTATGNGTGWSESSSATLLTYGDNNIDGNTNDGGNPNTLATR